MSDSCDAPALTDPRLSALFQRTTGAAEQGGHRLQLLRDSREHEVATLALIARAERHIIVENYRICDDDWGRSLLAALCQRAQDGLHVMVLADWLGSFTKLSRRWVKQLHDAGGEFRRFNTPGLGEPLAWVVRNHRKLISIDGCEAIITGWCQSAQWRGHAEHNDPWRDTGVRVAGEVVADMEAAFAHTWGLAGSAWQPQPVPHCPISPMLLTVENANVRLIVGRPQSSPLFRLDQLVINLAQTRVWISDAYPVGTPAYLDSLRQAAQNGVDVRLLVPGSSDLPLLGLLARSSYRPLLLAGVRVFEWNGAMLHAKTAVIDGCWARIGSSNLNPASWLGNYELDLVIENTDFAAVMESQFLDDLDNATEIVLSDTERVRLVAPRQPTKRSMRHHQGSATTLRVSRAMALAVRESRQLGPTDASLLGGLGVIGLMIAGLALWQPHAIAWPIAIIAALLSVNLLRIARRRFADYRKNQDPKA
ncbi:MAG: phospholipase D-like domain-containing protein [Paraperlucidibaca sp.]